MAAEHNNPSPPLSQKTHLLGNNEVGWLVQHFEDRAPVPVAKRFDLLKVFCVKILKLNRDMARQRQREGAGMAACKCVHVCPCLRVHVRACVWVSPPLSLCAAL